MSSRLPSAADSVAVDVRSSTAARRGERGSSAGAAPGPGRDWPRVPSLPWCPIVFAIVCAGLAVMRAVVLMRGGAPATVDSGNWLAFGHALLGSHVRSSTIVYPPVVPLILTSVSSVFGARVAVGLVGAVSSLAPGAAVYWVLRRSELRWSAVALAVLVTAAGSTGESTAWGGFPQLLGLGGMVVALWLLDEWLTEPTRRRGLAVGGALLFVGATSDIAFGATLVCAVLVVGLRTLAGADTVNRASRTLRTLPYVVLPMVPLVPLYSRLIQATRQTGPDHVGAKLTLSEVPSAVEFLYRDLPWPWRLALVSAVVAPLLFADRWRDRLWIVATSLLATASVTTIVLHEDRFLYLLPLGVALGLGLWARELAWAPLPFMRRFRPALAAALAVFVVAQIVTGAHAFGAQRDYYGILDPGSTAAIEWISHNTPRDALIAAPTVRGAPLGWWVEGLGRRQSLLASALRWLNFPDEVRRARQANAVFTENFPNDATIARARHDGVDYVLVPLASEIVDPVRLREYVQQHPQQVAYRNRTTYVLRV